MPRIAITELWLKHAHKRVDKPTEFTYDANLNVKTATDPRGHVTTHDYDANNNLVRPHAQLSITVLSFQRITDVRRVAERLANIAAR